MDEWHPLAREGEWSAAVRSGLDDDAVHVWRVALDDETRLESSWSLLSAAERVRAQRLQGAALRRRFVIAHGTLRGVLAGYLDAEPSGLVFDVGEHGKPSLGGETGARSGVEFNLSHSEDVALIAVARGRPVGVDVQRWSEEVEHLRLAERFFSLAERDALRGLSHARELMMAGFFAAWTRKEAYVKATGHGIARGLHHFDVSLAPGERARLLADRLDSEAVARWAIETLDPAPGYSGALVVPSPLGQVLRFSM
ncbi:MAG TPA: 4'-phosphopantetheinyl transferase superfamily protein [Gemmatimonadaceae bacterium]|nr:4'-phosphopantetheinyl transferase superfamily protein [Gemmatimonadaceae bacterium]